MNVHMVIGAGFGDEGKGTITAEIASKNPLETLVILNNGGAQRGHSVLHQGKVYNNKHFGSGSCFGSSSFFGPMFILDPMQFTQEYTQNLMETKPVIYRHVACRWVTPFDIIANQSEAVLKEIHNTCGMGIWKTIQRYNMSTLQKAVGEAYYIKPFDNFMELPYEERVKYLNEIADWYKKIGHYTPEYNAFLEDSELRSGLIDHFIRDCEFMYNSTKAVDNYDFVKFYKTVIFENGQGLAIGDDGHDNVNKTPSYTGLKALDSKLISHINSFIESFTIHYVSRTYETRHGDDFHFKSVDRKKISSYIEEDANNHYNQWQGEFKYGPLNNMLLTQRILNDLKDLDPNIRERNITRVILELTHCDEVSGEYITCPGVDEIRCTGTAEVN